MNCGRAITFVSTLPTMAAAGLLSAVPYSFGGWLSWPRRMSGALRRNHATIVGSKLSTQ